MIAKRLAKGAYCARMSKRFYLTTAIDYVNGEPHLGHAYEKVITDIIARTHRSLGQEVFYLTASMSTARRCSRRPRPKARIHRCTATSSPRSGKRSPGG